ncbi:MAG: MipA/OmpV family protein [Thermoanaerobaculales bacterium]
MKTRVLLSILLFFTSLPLFAQEESAATTPAASPVRWSLGLGVISSPRPYVGTDNSVTAIPLIELYYKKVYVQGIRAGIHLFERGDVVFDARARIVFAGLDPDDAPELEGMSERKSSIEGGFALDWSPGKYLLSATVFTDLLGRSGGQQAGLDLSRAWTFARYRWGLTPSVGVVWQSSDFVDYYVGVTPDEIRPGRPSFQGSSAFNFRASIFVFYRLTMRVNLVGLLRVQRLDSEISSSPIIDDTRSYFGLLGATYTFGKLPERPPAE